MINHKYKCIFIHIQRTGGTSIERTIQGEDQWNKLHRTKHILASTAKEIYADYWNDYFKFSFVRNPWDRIYSMAKMKWNDMEIRGNNINVNNYVNFINKMKYELPLFSESISRLHMYNNNYKENSVYCNILNEELDFIGKFENLEQDFQIICKNIGLKSDLIIDERKKVDPRFENYTMVYNKRSIKQIEQLYKNDLTRFNYTF